MNEMLLSALYKFAAILPGILLTILYILAVAFFASYGSVLNLREKHHRKENSENDLFLREALTEFIAILLTLTSILAALFGGESSSEIRLILLGFSPFFALFAFALRSASKRHEPHPSNYRRGVSEKLLGIFCIFIATADLLFIREMFISRESPWTPGVIINYLAHGFFVLLFFATGCYNQMYTLRREFRDNSTLGKMERVLSKGFYALAALCFLVPALIWGMHFLSR